jgi:ATP-dependent Clp protease protease subunit
VKNVNNSLTPVVLEERKMNVVAMDVYSRMLYDRIIYFGHEFNQDTCNLLNAQLLYLSSLDERDINVYINSPGGSVVDGLSSIDVMNFIPNNVSTTCIGMAASMGAVLLSCGEKGKRFVLPHSRVMIHQVSSGMRGTYSDIKIEMEQTERCRNDVYRLLADNMGKTFEEVEMLCDRNNWFIGQEAVELGIVDKVLTKN